MDPSAEVDPEVAEVRELEDQAEVEEMVEEEPIPGATGFNEVFMLVKETYSHHELRERMRTTSAHRSVF